MSYNSFGSGSLAILRLNKGAIFYKKLSEKPFVVFSELREQLLS